MTSERKFIEESVKRVLLKEYLKRKTERSGFGGLDIQRTPMGTRVTLIAERPGMVIGRKGETIKELTEYVENEFQFDNPQIEVKEVTNPNLNPHIMAQKLANALERGWHFRRAGHSTVRRIMGAGAKGCQVIISGKLTGQRHRTEKFREGHIKYCGETKLNWMLEGYAVAKKKLGVIGVKVQIMDPKAKLPDEIELRELKDVAEIKTIPEVTKPEAVVTETAEAETEPDAEVEAEDKEESDSEEEKEKKEKESKKKSEKKKSEESEPVEEAPDIPATAKESEADEIEAEKEPEEEPEEVDASPNPEAEPEPKSEPEPIENDADNTALDKPEDQTAEVVDTDVDGSDSTEVESENIKNDDEKTAETDGE
jgi:small subunit ribosomal protein S3